MMDFIENQKSTEWWSIIFFLFKRFVTSVVPKVNNFDRRLVVSWSQNHCGPITWR